MVLIYIEMVDTGVRVTKGGVPSRSSSEALRAAHRLSGSNSKGQRQQGVSELRGISLVTERKGQAAP